MKDAQALGEEGRSTLSVSAFCLFFVSFSPSRNQVKDPVSILLRSINQFARMLFKRHVINRRPIINFRQQNNLRP
jgi:hypothetical protein